MKQITIAGNIGKDATVRHTQGGDAVAGFSVAVEERSGQDKRTIWFDVSIWGKRGEKLAQYLTKGGKVTVAGELSTREHEGKTYLTVRADQITLMGGGDRNHDVTEPEPNRSQQQRSAPPSSSIDDDEIPF